MRLIYSVSPCLISASFINLQETINGIGSKMEAEKTEMANTNPPKSARPKLPGSSISDQDFDFPRALGRSLIEPGREEGTSLNYFNGYGCWCNFNNYKIARGQPKDYFDVACKRLHDNYLCIEQEFASRNEICQPESIIYTSNMLYVYITNAIYARDLNFPEHLVIQKKLRYQQYCRDVNLGNDCATEACLAEAQFLYDITPGYNYPADFDMEGAPQSIFSHTHPDWNYESECVSVNVNGNNLDNPPLCCGETPDRVRYNSNNKGCCNHVVYSLNNSCCKNDSVYDFGTC